MSGQGSRTRRRRTAPGRDAADANKFAESADGHAKSAEAAAKNANTYAREADEAAKKVEEYELEQQRKAREAAAKEVKEVKEGGDQHPKLTDEEIAALKAAGITPEQWAMARQLDKKNFLDFLVENGGQIIVDLLFEDIEKCFERPNFEDCFWVAVGALPWGKALKIIKEMPAIAKALKSIVTGLNDFLDKSAAAKKLLAKGEEVLEKLRKKNPPCVPGKKHSFAPGTPVRMADGTNKPIQDIRVGEQVLATDPETGKTAARAVTHLITGEGDKNLRELTVDTDGAAGQATGTITATDIHPFWVENRHTWVKPQTSRPATDCAHPKANSRNSSASAHGPNECASTTSQSTTSTPTMYSPGKRRSWCTMTVMYPELSSIAG
ncbi:polymorphic toxin-type HINT domain-containing protein [Streptomyces sp. NBC_00424]|nr:polymorphic toxin-type HINT domain-containing protein [Streptomyces sp. NBC_00424]MCX5077958.1 polymorphic toxin-type HINT domain-containing protein [Streptomyces sp. NBC_00424]